MGIGGRGRGHRPRITRLRLRRRVSLWTVLVAALAAAPASAGVPTPHAIDGPSPDIVSFEDVALAPDGTGVAVYVRRSGGVPALYASRLAGGRWSAPEQVPSGGGPVTAARAIARNGGRAVVVVQTTALAADRLWGTGTAPDEGWRSPVSLGTALAGSEPSLATNRGGTAYAIWASPGGGGSDVRAARFDGASWTALGESLDAVSTRPAGGSDAALAPDVAVDGAGNAVAVWSEPDGSGVRRVMARRLSGTALGQVAHVSPVAWNGAPVRTPADQPGAASAADGSALIVFRQHDEPATGPLGGRARPLGVRLAPDGSLNHHQILDDTRFRAPRADGSWPAVAADRRGFGVHTALRHDGGAARAALGGLHREFFERPVVLARGEVDLRVPPAAAMSARGSGLVGWVQSESGRRVVRADRMSGAGFGRRLHLVSDRSRGDVAGDRIAAAADDHGDLAVGFMQQTGSDRAIFVGGFDQPAVAPKPRSPRGRIRTKRVRLRWTAARDPRGIAGYRVSIDGRTLARHRSRITTATAINLRLAAGRRRWRVVAVDSAGQRSASRTRVLRMERRKSRRRGGKRPGRRSAGRGAAGPRRTM